MPKSIIAQMGCNSPYTNKVATLNAGNDKKMKKYKINDEITYNKYGEVKTGRIDHIETKKTEYENRETTEIVYWIKSKTQGNNLVSESEILMKMSPELKKLYEETTKLIDFYKDRTKDLKDALNSIFSCPTNNDWRIKNLKNHIKQLKKEGIENE
jgi:hypothetical protein